jgi:probable phosphoglycerate mutase
MVRLGFIRHARTQWNQEKKLQGRADIPLCGEGMRQAGLWADILKPEKFDLILSSPMTRARQTSQILSEPLGADIEFDAGLREQDFGHWEGRRIIDIRRQMPGEIERQESRGWEFCPPGGESRVDVLKRASQAIQRAADGFDKKKILVVCHSSVMKTILYKALGRAFAPGEVPILKDGYVHVMTWGKQIKIEQVNSIRLL